MPLFFQHTINETSKLAVWHITETENFFLQKVQLQKILNHSHKRLQHLAGRYLLQILQPDFPSHLIEIAASNKPILSNEQFHFSISHCGDYAAAIISENESAGIDVELITPKIKLVQHKFLNDDELRLTNNVSNAFLTLLWSCKEAIYKWHGKGSVDFKKNIIIKNISQEISYGKLECVFIKESSTRLTVHFHLFENLCLAWVTG